MIFCLYASKGCNYGQLGEDLKSYEFGQDKHTYLVGDLNFDASKTNALTFHLKRLKYTQLVNHATHLDGHILDQVYTSHANSNLLDVKLHHVYYSDHDAILVNVNLDFDE